MSLTIRPATVVDAPVLCNAERETARTPGLLVSRPDELMPDAFAQKITALSHDGLYVVAERDAQIIGHALLEPLGMEALAHVLSLTIVVHPGHLGQGVGTVLMKHLLDWARQRPGLLKVELRVREGNHRARRLYERFGFVEEGILRQRIRLPDGQLIGDVFMAWFAASPLADPLP
jgi:RimJ/RimL family protein N-acetyltransferase